AARSCDCDQTAENLCEYLCELTLQESAFIKYRPSEIAASSLRLALHTLCHPVWSTQLEAVSGYSVHELDGCTSELLAVFRRAASNSLQAVREKYSHAKFLCVSTLSPPELFL
ncbi:MAG: hypothetical protein SGPRY_012067, partial [Prymnesium sp.]